jgi:type I restriction enzyme S subunit
MLKNENRPGYKQTKVGWIPKEWECVPLGQVFKKRTARGKRGVPVFSVTQDRGMVLRATLDRKTGNAVSADKSLLVEPGDVAYNMMRMWQGAVAVCKERCVISPAYVVCRPNAGQADSNFMFSYFKSKAGMHKLFAYSYGVTADRLRLYYEDFCLVPAPLPSLPEQIAIAEVLECWDKAVQTLTLKIDKKRQAQKQLMNRLLSGKQRLPGFLKRWKDVRLGKLGEFSKGAGISKEELSPKGVPCIRYGEIYTVHNFVLKEFHSFISPSLASISARIRKNDLLFAGSGETAEEIGKSIAYMGEDEAYAGGDVILLSVNPAKGRADFISYYLNTIGRRELNKLGQGQSVVHIYPKNLAKVNLVLPPLEEQRAIAKVLSAADAEIDALERKLTLFKDQKKHLLNNLVTGTIRLPQFEKTLP